MSFDLPGLLIIALLISFIAGLIIGVMLMRPRYD